DRLPAKRFGRAELQSRLGMVGAVEADQDPKVTGAHVGGCYIVVHLEPPAGVSQITSDGDNPASKAPSSGSIIAIVLRYVELCAVDSLLFGPGGDDQQEDPARSSTLRLTEPSSRPARPPRPRFPTTMRAALRAASRSTSAAEPSTSWRREISPPLLSVTACVTSSRWSAYAR